jgi:methionyl-tRNA formyltransferase
MSAQPDTSLRVVLMTDFGAQVVAFFNQFLSANGHRLVAVVTTPGPKNRRTDSYLGVVQATPPGIDVIITTHPKRLAPMLRPFKPDLIWVMGFLLRLPEEVIELPRLGTINTHGGILPKYRGPNPPGWVFRNDEGEIGWTVHRMTAGIDEGPILGLASVQYGDDDDMQSLFPKWTSLLPELMSQSLQQVLARDPGEPQDESLAGYAGAFEDAWRQIDWSRPARSIHNQVRSWAGGRGMPAGAFGEIDGTRQLIFKTRLVEEDSGAAVPPGTLIERTDDGLLVQCGDGPLQILKWEAANKE